MIRCLKLDSIVVCLTFLYLITRHFQRLSHLRDLHRRCRVLHSNHRRRGRPSRLLHLPQGLRQRHRLRCPRHQRTWLDFWRGQCSRDPVFIYTSTFSKFGKVVNNGYHKSGRLWSSYFIFDFLMTFQEIRIIHRHSYNYLEIGKIFKI